MTSRPTRTAAMESLRAQLITLREILEIHISSYNTIDITLEAATKLPEAELRECVQDLFPGEIRDGMRMWPQLLRCMNAMMVQIRLREMEIYVLEKEIMNLEAEIRQGKE